MKMRKKVNNSSSTAVMVGILRFANVEVEFQKLWSWRSINCIDKVD